MTMRNWQQRLGRLTATLAVGLAVGGAGLLPARAAGDGVWITGQLSNGEVAPHPISGLGGGIDLTFRPSSLKLVCKGVGANLKCSYSGKLSVQNAGTLKSAPTRLRYYLSDDDVLDASDQMLKDQKVGAIKPGKTKKVAVKIKTAAGVDLREKVMFVAVDPDNAVQETDETNNVILFALPR